jgi:hypothetical protein
MLRKEIKKNPMLKPYQPYRAGREKSRVIAMHFASVIPGSTTG